MKIRVPIILLVLLASAVLGFFTWKKAASPVPLNSTLYALPTGSPSKVDLSNPVVTRLTPQTVQCAFKYRFVEGKPTAGSWYCCLVEFQGCPGSYREPVAARDLQAEGTWSREIHLIRPGAESFQLYFADAAAKHGPYRLVSNVLTGPVMDQPALKSPVKVTEFLLVDSNGQSHTSAEWKGLQAIVLLFLGTDCPVSNSYAPEYVRLARVFGGRGVRFYGIHSDPDVTREQAAQHAREYHLTFPILLDPAQVVARQTGVRVVPEAVVLSPAGQVLYRGRIDDRYLLDGKRKDKATVRDLEATLAAVLAGKQPSITETKAFGCPLPPPAK